MPYNTLFQRFRHAFHLIKTRPKTAWWLIILATLASVLAAALCGAVPILALPICAGISVGVFSVCLKTVELEDVGACDLFAAFRDLKTAKRVIGGVLWTALILCVWLIPVILLLGIGAFAIAGLGLFHHSFFDHSNVFSAANGFGIAVFMFIAVIVCCVFEVVFIVKALEYCFVPFILAEREDVSPFDAWKESRKLTYGIKGRLFGLFAIPSLIVSAISAVLSLLSAIPYIGGLFLLVSVAFLLACVAFLPYFEGLALAGFYVAAKNAPPQFRLYEQYERMREEEKQRKNVYYQYNQYQYQPYVNQNPPQEQPAPAPEPEPPHEENQTSGDEESEETK